MSGFGLRIARSQGMDGYTGNFNEFNIAPANTSKIHTGDPVVMNGGFVEEFSGNSAGAVAAAPIVGVFQGCRYVDSNGDYVFRNMWDGGAGRSDAIAHIAMPPHSLFYIKGDNGVAFTQADVGTRRAMVYAAGSDIYGDSRVTLGAVSATGPVAIQRLAPLPGNAWTNAEPIIEVAVIAQSMTAADAA